VNAGTAAEVVKHYGNGVSDKPIKRAVRRKVVQKKRRNEIDDEHKAWFKTDNYSGVVFPGCGSQRNNAAGF
jgi:hypothetical protein